MSVGGKPRRGIATIAVEPHKNSSGAIEPAATYECHHWLASGKVGQPANDGRQPLAHGASTA